jgi:hypothetical protein
MKDRPEPYDDYRHLHLTGTLLRPANKASHSPFGLPLTGLPSNVTMNS